MPTDNQYTDFGQHIGGSRKDMYSAGITLDDIMGMTDVERNKNLVKNKVWGKVDYQALVDEGRDKIAVFFIKTIRDSLPAKPTGASLEAGERYVNFINAVKSAVMECRTEADIQAFFERTIPQFVEKRGYLTYARDEYQGLVNNKFFKAAQVPSISRLRRTMNEKQFLFNDAEKTAADISKMFSVYEYKPETKWENRQNGEKYFGQREGYSTYFIYPPKELQSPDEWKAGTFYLMQGRNIVAHNIEDREDASKMAMTLYSELQRQKTAEPKKEKLKDSVPYLDHLERIGPDNRSTHVKVKPEDIQATFQFYGGEFGNYEGQKDRMKNVELSYDAFCDLARALNISVKDIAQEGTLSIAYGARGRGGQNAALAHYEPMYRVINLTKLKGAGSLGHEWAHSLDHYLFTKEFPGEEGKLTLDQLQHSQNFSSHRPDSLVAGVVNAMNWKPDGSGRTQFYRDAVDMDRTFHKSNVYYCRSEEMFARAFACYVFDKLESMGCRNDYLCGHANLGAYPAGLMGLKGDPDRIVHTAPQGEERQVINQAFDKMFDDLRERGLVHSFDEKEISLYPLGTKEEVDRIKATTEPEIDYSSAKQMSIFDFMAADKPVKEWKPKIGKTKTADTDIDR